MLQQKEKRKKIYKKYQHLVSERINKETMIKKTINYTFALNNSND